MQPALKEFVRTLESASKMSIKEVITIVNVKIINIEGARVKQVLKITSE